MTSIEVFSDNTVSVSHKQTTVTKRVQLRLHYYYTTYLPWCQYQFLSALLRVISQQRKAAAQTYGRPLFRSASKLHTFCPRVEFYILAKDITLWDKKEQIVRQDKELLQWVTRYPSSGIPTFYLLITLKIIWTFFYYLSISNFFFSFK